jgi:hypothetical protein
MLCGNVYSPAVTEIRVGQQLPAADATDVNMHKLFTGVITNAAAMEMECCVPQLCCSDSRQTDINGHGLHVQTVPGYRGRAAAQKRIAPGSAVSAYHVDFRSRTAKGTSKVPEQVENPGIIRMNCTSAMIAKKVFKPLKRYEIVGVSMTVDNIKVLIGMRVIQPEFVNGLHSRSKTCTCG